MRAALTVIALGSALFLAANSAQALGFGQVSNATQLGQTLNFAAAVHLQADETLGRECIFAEVFSGDNKLQPGQIRVTLEGNPDSPERMVRITSSALIDEPIMTVSVTLGCRAKVTRKFVAFIDPPGADLAQGFAPADAAALAPQRVDSQVAPLLSIVQAAQPVVATPQRAAVASGSSKTAVRPATPPAARQGEPAPPARRVAARKEPAPRKPVSAPRSVVATRLLPAVPRLQLEATAPVMARAASAATTNAAAAAPALALAPAASSADASALALAQQRIVTLEEGLALLRADSLATQKALAGLQAQLREAESQPRANPLVYALAWLSGLLLLALAALWWRQSRNRQTAQWWAASGQALASDADSAGVHTRKLTEPAAVADESVPQALTGPMTVANAFVVVAATDTLATGPAPLYGAHTAAMQRPGPVPAAAAEPVRELSVEELIDLEQQAEFFVVLGQDEAAIDLLVSHVRSDGGISPLPYLKLLEIYRRRGDRDAYERIRERFNRRFNAYAPDWDSDLQHGRSLEDYPDIIARLNALWPAPAQAMETLDASLFRRNKSDDTFDLPAYRELLFLYSIARDLAEHGAYELHGEVDLLLPLAEDEAARQPVTRLVATPGQQDDFAHSDMMTMPVDLDISLGDARDPRDDAVETTPSALRRVPDHRFGTESGFLDLDVNDARVVAKARKTDVPTDR
jgi:pilus assembly protein FimV